MNRIASMPAADRLVVFAEVAELARDYQKMRDMFLVTPISFERMLATLHALDQRINQVE